MDNKRCFRSGNSISKRNQLIARVERTEIYSEKRHILSSKDDQGKRTKVTRLNRERFSMNLFSGTNWNVGFESCKSDDATEIDPRKRTYVNRNQYSKKGTKYVFTKSENKRTT